VGVKIVGKKRRITKENAKKFASNTGSGAKKIASKTSLGAKKIASKTSSGAKRIASAPGRKVRQKMATLNDRMLAVQWTPKKMINEYIRFNMTGIFNSIFAYIVYELFYWINLTDTYRAQSAWAACILIGQVECHYAHYRFTFGSAANYLASLRWAVIIYTTILILSTIIFHIMVTEMDIYHRFAWLINIVLFGFVNFAFLRWLAFPPEFDKSLLHTLDGE
jgi:putative flippase GtrA